MARKKNVYAVAVGRTCGIFTDWTEAEAQIKGFPGAKYQGFATEEQALAWLDAPEYGRREPALPQSLVKSQTEGGKHRVVVHTDGSCRKNPGPGGYGAILDQGGQQREISGGFRRTTNNRMEMMAAIVALESLDGCTAPIDLYSDSSYLVNALKKGWLAGWQRRNWCRADGSSVANIDLWQRLAPLLLRLKVTFHWLRGHAGDPRNERCDQLATAAARQKELLEDVGYAEDRQPAEAQDG